VSDVSVPEPRPSKLIIPGPHLPHRHPGRSQERLDPIARGGQVPRKRLPKPVLAGLRPVRAHVHTLAGKWQRVSQNTGSWTWG
jgi:hypothetical protein